MKQIRPRVLLYAATILGLFLVSACAPSLSPWRLNAINVLLLTIPIVWAVIVAIVGLSIGERTVPLVGAVMQMAVIYYEYYESNKFASIDRGTAALVAECVISATLYGVAVMGIAHVVRRSTS